MVVAGIAVGLHGRAKPVFSVPFKTAMKAYAGWCTVEARIVDAAGDRYFALFTNHYRLVDDGIGLILTGVTLAGIALLLRTRSACDGAWLRTPERHWTFLVAGAGVIIWLWMAMIYSLQTDLRRMYFPTCADSIGIPIYANTILTLLAAPISILVGWAIARRFGRLPAPLHQWDAEKPVRSSMITIVFGTGIIGFAALLAESMISSMSVAAPSLVVAIYLLAATRAALLSPRAPVHEGERTVA
jgi:small-conductance mechanosensitive channel